MADVQHTEIFDCTPEQFYKILIDYSKYSEFLSEVSSCSVVGEEGDDLMVEFKVSVIKNIEYLNRHSHIENKRVSWTFVKGQVFKSMRGSWDLEETSDGKTKALYSAEAKFGLLVPKMITKTLLSVNLPAMMKAYHRRVEDLYG